MTTSVVMLGALLACAAVALATALGWTLAALAAVLPFHRRLSARTRAVFLAQVRLLPLVCVAIVVPAQVTGFIRHEAGVGESAGPFLWAAAAAGFALALHAIWCAATSWRETARVITAWKATATPLVMTHWSRPAWTIQPGSPVVAVAGVFRPQLFVARQVVTSCTAGELAAIAAHEATHVSARDNLVRGLFRLTPGAGIFRHLADRLERDWNAAAEEAADLLGSRSTSPLDLASALTKVARLATSAPARSLVVSALIGGSDLQARVRRLLEAPAPPRRHPAVWIPAIGLMAAATIVQSAPMLAVVHEFFELLVRH